MNAVEQPKDTVLLPTLWGNLAGAPVAHHSKSGWFVVHNYLDGSLVDCVYGPKLLNDVNRLFETKDALVNLVGLKYLGVPFDFVLLMRVSRLIMFPPQTHAAFKENFGSPVSAKRDEDAHWQSCQAKFIP